MKETGVTTHNFYGLKEEFSAISVTEEPTHTIFTIWQGKSVHSQVKLITHTVGGILKPEVNLHELLGMFFRIVGYVQESDGSTSQENLPCRSPKYVLPSVAVSNKVIYLNKIMLFADIDENSRIFNEEQRKGI